LLQEITEKATMKVEINVTKVRNFFI